MKLTTAKGLKSEIYVPGDAAAGLDAAQKAAERVQSGVYHGGRNP